MTASSLELGSPWKSMGANQHELPSTLSDFMVAFFFLMFVGFSLKIDPTLWISNVLLFGKSILVWQCHMHRKTLAGSDF